MILSQPFLSFLVKRDLQKSNSNKQRYSKENLITTVKFNEILPHINLDDMFKKSNKNKHIEVNGMVLKVLGKSLRLPSFYKIYVDSKQNNHPFQCACCGEKAPDHLSLVKGQGENGTLELISYCEDGRTILFTHDHIQNRKSGGSNTSDNVQLLCCECNSLKADVFENLDLIKKYFEGEKPTYSLELLREVKKEIDENKTKLFS